MKVSEKLNVGILREALGTTAIELCVMDTVDSTNAVARRALQGGLRHPTAFVADAQTAGRGRMGRSFYSPADTGIYCSLLLPMNQVQVDTVSVTAVAAVAVRRAILRVTGVSTAIKWVNDLYLGDRKVCGILAETAMGDEGRYLILGVGVNLCTDHFPDELCSIAGSLLADGSGLRNRLTAELIVELSESLLRASDGAWLDEYRAHSNILGRPIRYTEQGREAFGIAEAIDEMGHLIVRQADGSLAVLASGEISVRISETKKEN